MIVAVTGHRPDKIFKLNPYSSANEQHLIAFAMITLNEMALNEMDGIERILTGMAQGWDIAIAHAAVELSIPFTAAIPCAGQSRFWPKDAQKRYEHLLAKADVVKMVNVGEYSAAKMEARNQWMVDHCTHLLALWNHSSGGTGNTVEYANLRLREVINVWPKWQAFKVRA